MIYRIILELDSIRKVAFDFSNVEAAGEIAKTLFAHLSDAEDRPKIWIEIIRGEEEEPQDD